MVLMRTEIAFVLTKILKNDLLIGDGQKSRLLTWVISQGAGGKIILFSGIPYGLKKITNIISLFSEVQKF